MPRKPPDDDRWIRDAVARYERPLQQYAARLLGDTERARDVVQDAFLKLCDQEEAKLADHLAQWLYTVCRNAAFNINRKEKRMHELSGAQASLQRSDQPGPMAAAEANDERDTALRLLDGLPAHQQEVIRLKFQHDLTYRQINKITGHSVSTVGYLIHAGLATIREQMTPTAGTDSDADASDDQVSPMPQAAASH